jgi:hypothetical protein
MTGSMTLTGNAAHTDQSLRQAVRPEIGIHSTPFSAALRTTAVPCRFESLRCHPRERACEAISGLQQAPFAARRDYCRDVLGIAPAMGDSNAILWH